MSKFYAFYRNCSAARYELAEHISNYKWWYISLGIAALMGVIIGLITGFTIAPDATIDNIPDSIFISFINKNISVFGVFFARLFSLIAILLIIMIANIRPFMCFLNVLFLVYRGFVVGATSALLIVLFNVGGILNVIFIIIPSHFVILACLISFSAVCMCYNMNSRIYGGSIFSKSFLCENKRYFYILGTILFIAILYESLLIPWLATAIIVS